MIFTNDSSATDITQWTGATDATDVVPFAEFWSTISGSTNTPTPWWNMLFLPNSEYLWFPKDWGTVIDLPAYEKSIHGKVRGKLKAPKPQCPRGFRHLTLRHEFSGPHFK